jgi:hypothetical protein
MSIRDIFIGPRVYHSLAKQFASSDIVRFYLGEHKQICFTADWTRIENSVSRLCSVLVRDGGPSAVLEFLIQGYGLLEGVKTVNINQLDAEALENTRVTISLEDYNQPFSTMFVELPPKFYEKHVVECPQGGTIFAGQVTPKLHYPHLVGLHHFKSDQLNYLIGTVYFTSNQVFTVLLNDHFDPPLDLDQNIQRAFSDGRLWKDSEAISRDENGVAFLSLRIALNTLLILEGEGMKKLGPSNPKYYEKLVRNVRKARTRKDSKDKIETAETLLQQEPIYYTFDQKVVIYDRDDLETDPVSGVSGHVGYHVHPHWRSGHYRMQRYGVGNLLRKRIRIKPVMVNKHRFGGSPANTTAMYEVRP